MFVRLISLCNRVNFPSSLFYYSKKLGLLQLHVALSTCVCLTEPSLQVHYSLSAPSSNNASATIERDLNGKWYACWQLSVAILQWPMTCHNELEKRNRWKKEKRNCAFSNFFHTVGWRERGKKTLHFDKRRWYCSFHLRSGKKGFWNTEYIKLHRVIQQKKMLNKRTLSLKK